jgi:NhaA family Na+:H+ antiporter
MARQTTGHNFPARPIDRWVHPLKRFLGVQAMSGIILFALTVVALVLANTGLADGYREVINTKVTIGAGSFVLDYPFWYWVNDALMALFFFVIGLEIKRELVGGELSDPRKAALPIVAAAGGAAVPALIYLFTLGDAPGGSGWAVPMATDIAFVVGALALFGARVPRGLTIFVLSLAIIDDLFAVVIIALFYTEEIKTMWLAGSAAGLAVVFTMQRLNIRSIPGYVLVGAAVWLCMLKSGVHPTIAGVILGLMTPARAWLNREFAADTLRKGADALQGDASSHDAMAAVGDAARAGKESLSPLERLEHGMHPWVAFVILPIFVFVNAGVALGEASLTDGVGFSVMLGLAIGKPVGIFLAAWLTVKTGLAKLPSNVNWPMLLGAGMLCGIGFTMALFIANLGLKDALLESAKIGILAGSGISIVAGLTMLAFTLPKKPLAESET